MIVASDSSTDRTKAIAAGFAPEHRMSRRAAGLAALFLAGCLSRPRRSLPGPAG